MRAIKSTYYRVLAQQNLLSGSAPLSEALLILLFRTQGWDPLGNIYIYKYILLSVTKAKLACLFNRKKIIFYKQASLVGTRLERSIDCDNRYRILLCKIGVWGAGGRGPTQQNFAKRAPYDCISMTENQVQQNPVHGNRKHPYLAVPLGTPIYAVILVSLVSVCVSVSVTIIMVSNSISG